MYHAPGDLTSPDINKVYACVFRPAKAQCLSFISTFHSGISRNSQISLKLMAKFINLR